MASIWLDVKAQEQRTHASDKGGDRCLQPKDVGPCKELLGQFFFDADAGKCAAFVYGGCGGNDNRFDSILNCTESCVTDPVEKRLVRQRTCALPVHQSDPLLSPQFKSRTCIPAPSRRFHYNASSNACEEVDYQGCFGTDNLFNTSQDCLRICKDIQIAPVQPPPVPIDSHDIDICSLPPSVDTPQQTACNARFPMWSFDAKQGACVGVFFNGCGATENLFDSQEQCMRKCRKGFKGKLNIFAPSDMALEDLYAQVGRGQEVFTNSPLLGKKFVLSSLSYGSCANGTQQVQTLNPGFTISCKDVVENAFDGGSFRIHMTAKPGVTADEIRAAATNELPAATEFRDLNDPSLPQQSRAVKASLTNAGLHVFSDLWDKVLADEEDIPRPTAKLCSMPKDEGDGTMSNLTRFHYEFESGFCKMFLYSGSGGNENNFHTYDTCTEFCGRFQGRVAVVNVLDSKTGASLGNLTLTQADPDRPLFIKGHLRSLKPGPHGFHVHQVGDLGEGCKASGSHFNPKNTSHGAPDAAARHVGDLGNILTLGGEPWTPVDLKDSVASLFGSGSGNGDRAIVGRSVVVHERADDLGGGGDDESLRTGNAGARVACGLVVEVEATTLLATMSEAGPVLKTPPPRLALPAQDKELRETSSKVKVTTFFKVWDLLLKSDLASEDQSAATAQTIVTVPDFSFVQLVPAGADPNPLYERSAFQRTVVGAQLIAGARVDPADGRIRTEGGLVARTVADQLMTFKYDDDVLRINGVPVKAIQTSANSVLYVVEDFINVNRGMVEQYLKRDAGNDVY